MKGKFARIAVFIAILLSAMFPTGVLADDGTNTEPTPVTEVAETKEIVFDTQPTGAVESTPAATDEEETQEESQTGPAVIVPTGTPLPNEIMRSQNNGGGGGNPSDCDTNPDHPNCPNPEETGCNENNPENCPEPEEICENGQHTGNPHCNPTATSTSTTTPSTTPSMTNTPVTVTPTAPTGTPTGTATATNTPQTSTPTIVPTATTAVPTETTAVPTLPTTTATSTTTSTSTPTIVPTTGTPEPSQTPTASPSPTVTATSVQVCDDEDALNYGNPMPCVYPTNTSTPTATNTPVTATPTEVTSTPTGTATATNTPVITPTPEKVVEEKGVQDKKKAKQVTVPATCQGHDKIVFSIGNTDASDIWIYSSDLTTGFMATAGINGWNDAPSFDPDNPCIRFAYNHFVAIEGTGELWIWNGSNQPIKDTSGSIIEGLSPDWGSNNKIAYIHDGRIWTVNPDGSGQFDTGLYGSQPEWSWDAKALSFINDKGELTLVRTDDWTHIGGISQPTQEAPVWTADQKMVCSETSNEGCLNLTVELNPGVNGLLYESFIGFSVEPRGNKVLVVVDNQHLEIRGDGPGFALSENQSFGIVTDWFTMDKATRVVIPGTE